MSNHKIHHDASPAIPNPRASDVHSSDGDSIVAPPLGIRSWASKLDAKRKRRSLFGRFRVDAAAAAERRRSSLPRSVCAERTSTIKSQDRRSPLSPAGRATTAADASQHLQLKDVFRIRPDTRHGPSCNSPREHFKTGKQYYRHLKKSSISPPFGFEHITHTLKEQLPGIDRSNEADLAAKFWAVNQGQRSRHSLRGIRANDLPERRLTMAFANGARSRSLSHEPRRRSSASMTASHSGFRKDSATLRPNHDRHLSHDSAVRSLSEPTPSTIQRSPDVLDTAHQVMVHPSRRANRMLPTLPEQTTLSLEGSWEDDVDFCYEQAAEATCDFDWMTATATAFADSPYADVKTTGRDSVWSAPTTNSTSTKPSTSPESTPAVLTCDFADPERRRAPSVGHRGFLAARSSNGSLSAAANPSPPILQLTPDSTDGRFPPTKLPLHMGGNVPKSPSSPRPLHLAVRPITSLDELSDPESTRTGGSKHRKSSSFGSSSSSGEGRGSSSSGGGGGGGISSSGFNLGLGLGRSSSGRNSNSNNHNSTSTGNRWSLASFAAVPELLHSHRRSKTTTAGKLRISEPVSGDTSVSGDRRFERPRDSTALHRPQTSADRSPVQTTTTKRVSPRERALTSAGRRSPLNPMGRRETSALGNGPAWI